MGETTIKPKKNTNPNSAMGRPTKYSVQLADEICDAVASSNLGLKDLTGMYSHWPHRANIFIWLRKYPDFRDKYTQAKKDQSEVFVDYIQELLADSHKYEDENGRTRIDVAMLRLKVDTIKWQAGKLNCKVYGDKLQVEPTTTLNQAVTEVKSVPTQNSHEKNY